MFMEVIHNQGESEMCLPVLFGHEIAESGKTK